MQVDQAGRHEAKGMGELLETITAVFGPYWLLTLDAAYTERGFTTQVIEAGGAYLIPLKNNVKDLKEWAVLAFGYPTQNGVVDVEYRSGEVWERRTDVLTDTPDGTIPEAISQALPAVKTLIRREHRITRRDGSQTVEVRYAVSSKLLTAREAEDVWRGHRGIENCSHHRRDTILHEDRCRSRKGAQGRAVLNGVVLALLASQTRHVTALVRRLRPDPLAALRLLRPKPG